MELGPSPKALMQMIQIGIRKLLVPACLVQNLGARQATHKHLRAPARHCSYSCWTILTRGGGVKWAHLRVRGSSSIWLGRVGRLTRCYGRAGRSTPTAAPCEPSLFLHFDDRCATKPETTSLA